MSERHHEQQRNIGQKRTLDETISAVEEFGIVDSKEWDAEVFGEVSEVLRKEFQQAGAQRKSDILTERYADALRRPYTKSHFWNTAAMRVPRLDVLRVPGLQFGDNNSRIDPSLRNMTMDVLPTVYQYGSSRFYEVHPGRWVDVQDLHDEDIVTSSSFTSCTALIVRHESRVFFSHITLGGHTETLRTLLKQLESEFPRSAQRAVFFPSADAIRGEIAEVIKDDPSIIRGAYTDIEDHALNSHGTQSTSILIGRTFMRTFGVKRVRGAAGKGEDGIEIIPETIQDYA